MSFVFWLLNDFHLKLKNIIWLLLKAYFDCFAKGHIYNVVSTLSNVAKPDVENNSVVSTLSEVVHIDVEIHNVDSTLFNVVSFDVEVHNVVSILICGCFTSRRRINLNTTLDQWWNVCCVASLNITSLRNKINDLGDITSYLSPDYLVLSQTELDDSFPSA